MVEAGGIEPATKPHKQRAKHGVGHEKGPEKSEDTRLQNLIRAWDQMPEHIRMAIHSLAELDSSE
jgi:hypothetical protein